MSQGLTENILLRTTDCLSAAAGSVIAGTESETPQDAHNIINLTVAANDGYQRMFITPDYFDRSVTMNRRQRRAAGISAKDKTKR